MLPPPSSNRSPTLHSPTVQRLLVLLSTFVLGSLGWYVGESLGYFTAFALSMVGTGAGVYFGRQLARRWGL